MNPRNRFRLGWYLLAGVSGVCIALAVWSMTDRARPISVLDPIWRLCCQGLAPMFGRASPIDRFPALSIAGWGFLSGGAWVAFRHWAQTRRFVGGVLQFRTADLPAEDLVPGDLGLGGRVDLCDRPEAFAFCHGYLRPRLCVSTGLLRALSRRQVRAVLLHELYHLRHHHPLFTLAAQVLADWLFFLPVTADLRDACLARLELEADRHAVEKEGRRPLAGALLQLLTQAKRGPQSPGVAITRLDVSEARIRHLLGDPNPLWRPSAHRVAVTMGVIATVCMALQSTLA